MPLPIPHRELIDELFAFVSKPEYAQELVTGRGEYVFRTGEAFDEDRSFDARMQGFLDWLLFDRPLAPHGEPPVRAYPVVRKLDATRALPFRILGRTVHGVFEVRAHRKGTLTLLNLLTGAEYRVEVPQPAVGFEAGEIFEGRLIPFGGWLLSAALIFHPRAVRSEILHHVRQQHQSAAAIPVQEVVFTLSRMANKAEHYRNVRIEEIYDFSRPPPKVGPSTLRFERTA